MTGRVNWSLKENNLVKYRKKEIKNNKNFESKKNTTDNSSYVINSFPYCKYKYNLEQKEFFFFFWNTRYSRNRNTVKS